MNHLFEPGRRHIIKRPRLTGLLDAATARILLLVAPAGYGKTTLAREWLAERPHGWYRGTSAAADVAALAVRLARAASTIVPDAGERMGERLRATGTPERDVEPLAELLAEDLAGWPNDAWIAVDDYQFACDSPFAERFVELVFSQCPVRLFVTTRVSPNWATSRRLVYGEIYQIGRSVLAMSQDEASEVLTDRPGSAAQGLLALADGWPAVIGLAALAGDVELPEGSLPEALYTYFAEELYQAADPEVREGLSRLALPSTVPPGLAESILGESGERVMSEGLRLGFFTSAAQGTYELHPLVRGFLESKLREQAGRTGDAVPPVVRALISRQAWDDAFSLLERFFDPTMLADLLEAALSELLREARLPTLARWLECAREHGIDSAVFDLADAELAFREGKRDRAEALALQAARGFGAHHELSAQAFCLAGTSAHLNYSDKTALEYFARANHAALTNADRRAALWGQLVTVAAIEEEDPTEILSELERHSGTSPDDLLRIGSGQICLSQLSTTLKDTLERVRPLIPLIGRGKDPLIESSFLNSYGNALVVAGRYSEALRVIDDQIEQALRFRLTFVLPHAYLNRGAALWGLRHFKRSRNALDQAENCRNSDDGFLRMNIGVVRARLHLATGAVEEALDDLATHRHRSASVAMQGEFLACTSLALACAGRSREATRIARRARSLSRRTEVVALVPWVLAITALRTKADDRHSITKQAFTTALHVGNLDSGVTAYRAFPQILHSLATHDDVRDDLAVILEQARDHVLAKQSGIPVAREPSGSHGNGLTRREREVLDLLSRGLPNKEIAKVLHITVGTVKAHVHQIYRKLDVRSRAEAILVARNEN